MSSERYNRWQGLAIAQLSVAVALISGLSVAGLGAGLTLVQDASFMKGLTFKYTFAISMLALLLAAVFSCATVITRTLDFQLTARKVRKKSYPQYGRSLTFLWMGPDGYGLFTKILFGSACLLFMIGLLLLVISVTKTYARSFGLA